MHSLHKLSGIEIEIAEMLCILYYLVFTDDYFVYLAKALESQATAAGDDALKLPARTVRRSDALSVAKRLAAKR